MMYVSNSLAVLALVLVAASNASANELRFSTTAPGGIVATGNTLGLSKDTSVNGPGVRDSIGTFVSLESVVDATPANPANPYPQGTTSDWHQNGSAATLSLPQGTELGFVEILYAELLWGGSTALGGEDVTAFLDSSVNLSAGGVSLAVAPDPATALTLSAQAISGFPIRYYMRSANVTDFVRTHRGGEYAVRGVPATQTDTINSLNAAGWTLVVAYRNDAEPLRNLTVFVGGSFVDENTQEDYAVSGFCAPPSGNIFGTAAISAIEGDANLVGDQLLIAPAVDGAFVPLSGPNNPANNFFCSQLNGADGQLDTSGTFGDVNHDAAAGVNVVGGRQGWDVTTVALSSADGQLFAGQQSAVLRTITTGDSFVPTLAAFQIDVNAPNLTTSSILPDRSAVAAGDVVTVTSTARNTGLADASSLLFQLTVPAGLTLESFTSDGIAGDLQGQAVNTAALAAGVVEGTLLPGGTRTVVVTLRVVGPPAAGLFFVQPIWSYDFVTCDGSAPISETYQNGATVTFIAPPPDAGTIGVDAGAASADAGSAAGEGEGEGDVDAGDGGNGVDAGPFGEPGVGLSGGTKHDGVEGCGCSTHSSASVTGAGLSLFALAMVGRRARMRARSTLREPG